MEFDFNPGEPITNPYGEKSFTSVNGSLFKESSAATVFGRYFKETFEKKDTLYIVIGSDSGLLPFYLAEHFKDKREGRKFIFIDFQKVFADIDISDLPSWIECYPADFPMEVLSQSEVEYMASGKIQLTKSLAIIDAKYDDAYGLLLAYTEDNYRKLMFAENVTSVTRSFVDAQTMNIHRNIRPISLLRGRLKKRDVLMIGGGPSLDDSIDWIKAHADKLIIFAAARTSARLLKEGIEPDFLVSVDPHDLSFDNSKQMLEFEKNTILMNCHHINPKLLNQWPLNSVYFGEALSWGEHEENSSSPGPTVIHSAIHQAVFMGAENVYLTGVDLCFYQGKTHASGSAESQVGKLGVRHHITQVETYSGDMAETDQAFSSGVDTLAWLVKGYETHAPDCQLYNLSPYAAKVEGVGYKERTQLQFSDLPDKAGLIGELNAILDVDLKSMAKHQQKYLQELRQKRLQLKQAIKLAERGLELTEQYHDEAVDSEKIIKVQSKLDKELGEMGEMLYHYGIDYFRDAFRPVEDEQQMTDDEITLTLESYFKGMKKSCLDFIERLEKSIAVLKARIEEYKPDSRPESLIKGWIERFEAGRYRIWQHYHPDLPLSAADEQALATAADILHNNLSHTDTEQAKLLKQRSLSPVELHAKAVKAYDKHDLSTLEAVAQQLKKVSGHEGQELASLVTGMIADLNGQSEQAVEAYSRVTFRPFQLLALKRLLHYSMVKEEHEKVLIYLEALCGFSLEYMLPYADYLLLLGQDEFAFNVLDAFTKQMPQHFTGLLKLTELALKLGKVAEACQALELAAKLEPDNPQVKQMLSLLSSS